MRLDSHIKERKECNEVHRQFVRLELERSKIEAADPDMKWLTQDDIMTKIDQQRKARRGV